MNKDTAINTTNAIQLSVAEPPPRLGQWLPAGKRVLRLRHALDPPLCARRRALGIQHVQHGRVALALERVQVLLPGHALALDDEDAAVGVVLGALVKGLLDNGAGGQPGGGHEVEGALKLLADAAAGGEEELVLGLLGGVGVGGLGVVPGGVEAADHGAEGEAAGAEALLDARGLEGVAVVARDAVIVGVNGLDEVFVNLVVQQLDV